MGLIEARYPLNKEQLWHRFYLSEFYTDNI